MIIVEACVGGGVFANPLSHQHFEGLQTTEMLSVVVVVLISASGEARPTL